jgi:3-oxoacyl-[acyl-carrier-protein] synthase III
VSIRAPLSLSLVANSGIVSAYRGGVYSSSAKQQAAAEGECMMTYRIGILGTGSYLPVKVLTNDELERFLDTTAQKIVDLTGIRERRIATQYSGPQGSWPTVLYAAIDKDENTSTMGAVAALRALEQAQISPLQVRYIIVATNSQEQIYPATAIKIQHYIGAEHAIAWDLQASCTGFIFALIDAERHLFVDKHLSGQDHYALVIGSDTMSRTVSRLDRNTAIMFADGAGAVVLGTQACGCIRSSWLRTQYSSTIQLDTEFKRGHDDNPDELMPKNFIYQEAKAVLRYASRVMHEALMEALKRAELTVHDLDYLITHQANQRMVQKVADLAHIDIAKVHRSGEWYGNTSAATHPTALDELSRVGKIRRGSLIGLTSFGAGITWGACILEW